MVSFFRKLSLARRRWLLNRDADRMSRIVERDMEVIRQGGEELKAMRQDFECDLRLGASEQALADTRAAIRRKETELNELCRRVQARYEIMFLALEEHGLGTRPETPEKALGLDCGGLDIGRAVKRLFKKI